MISLPKLDKPIYTLTLPSTGKAIKYRQFLVKEEKLLLTAFEQGNLNDDSGSKKVDGEFIVDNIKTVLQNCTFGNVNIDSLTSFDLEYIFINLFEKSKGSIVSKEFICEEVFKNEDGTESKCGHITKINFDLRNVFVDKKESHKNVIKISDDIGIVMKYPSFNTFYKTNFSEISENRVDIINSIIIDSIESIFDKDGTVSSKDIERKQLEDWIDELPTSAMEQIYEFFETMPEVVGNVNFKCGKCGYNHNIQIKGLSNFLD